MAARDEAFRREMVALARTFKRSWVDMAEALSRVRADGLHRRWGYDSLHGYALEELNIKGSTCDKLTASFAAMERHVPHVLTWDGVAQRMPEVDAVDYFARAVDPPPERGALDEDVVEELKQAIFDEGISAPSARRRFNPVLQKRSQEDEHRALLAKVRASARRLETLLPEVDGLPDGRVEEVQRTLEDLQRDLDELD
ncbi:MAG: hypothetical protein ACFCGT_13605 [Sandaracinaceae bacterium]